jgi:bifunctional non-homologous end joining protein LigD
MMARKRESHTKRRGARGARRETMFGKVRLTHPDRIYWRDAGVTKEQLAKYYKRIWQRMRPYVTGRVLALVRCPEGAEGQCFFQKHARAGILAEFLHAVQEDGEKIIAIDRLDGLIALVQGGVLEVHARGSAVDDRARANRLVFDLDPGPGTTFKDVIEAAREVRKRLQRVKLKSYVKTTGGKGLHVVVPIKPTPWDVAKKFAHTVALSMQQDEPQRYTANPIKARRHNRVFIDYLRNSREATAIVPYSTRARAGAPLAVPLSWIELSSLKAANQYTVKNIWQRLSKQKSDPWAGMGRSRPALPAFK